jgi:Cation transporter/ATPase, N-terminus
MDALIDELESQDGHAEDDENEEEATPGGGRVVPEDQLQTDTRIGLTEAEVHARRKKYGLNQMKEEKENLFLKFLGYFIGPIQFVMEVCTRVLFSPLFNFLLPGALPDVPAVPACILPPPRGPLGCGWGASIARRKDAKQSSECSVLIKTFVIGCRCSCCRSRRLGRFRRHLRAAIAECRGRFHPRIPSWFHCGRAEEDPCPESCCAP